MTTTTMTRQQLVGQLVVLCCLSFVAGLFFLTSFEAWLRSNPRYWLDLGMMIVFLALIVFVFRRFVASFQPKSS